MRVAVAMSGGVDSAVAALQLKGAGYEVVGLSMQLIDHSEGGVVGRCCSGDDLFDARRIAGSLGIPHYVLDFEETFLREVRQPFVSDWLAGDTPVPCLECNTRVKFAPLLERARAFGCERLATGHYARLVTAADGSSRLARPLDRDKDQTWFLYELTPELLSLLLFPLGDLKKSEVRLRARTMGLPVADKPESQEICFVPPGQPYHEVVDRAGPAADRSGNFISVDGSVLGSHAGYHRFTVGQRRGLGQGFGERRYVIDVDPSSHRVVLGEREDLLTREFLLRDLVWHDVDDGKFGAQIRSRGAEYPATIERLAEARARVTFDQPIPRTAPGQAVVAYRDDIVLGGGRVARPDQFTV